MFANDPVNVASLRSVDLDGELGIDQLTLKSGRRIDSVHARIVSHDGRADISPLEAQAFGGSARTHLVIDAAREGQTRITLRLDAKGLELAALLAAFGVPQDVRGGKTDITVDVAMQGDSPRQWASTVSGTATAIVGPATIVHSKGDAASAFSRLAEAVNPFRAIDAATELQCAVIRLPLANGIAHVDRGIAMETKKIGVAASGTLDLRDETLDFALKPQGKGGHSGQSGAVRRSGPVPRPLYGTGRRRRRQGRRGDGRAPRGRLRHRRPVDAGRIAARERRGWRGMRGGAGQGFAGQRRQSGSTPDQREDADRRSRQVAGTPAPPLTGRSARGGKRAESDPDYHASG